MSVLPSALSSPRIENGVIRYFYKDTFEFIIHVSLKDHDGNAVLFKAGDILSLEFTAENGALLKEMEFRYDDGEIPNGEIKIQWDTDTTSMFPKGKYKYNVRLNGEYVTTLANDNRMVVE